MNEVHEVSVNLHMHTTYSDGSGSHEDIARAALQTGLDAVIVTDHNVLVQGVEKYYTQGKRKTLLLTAEEIHDQARNPQKNHLLVFNANRELATFAENPQTLLDTVRHAGGISFLAHPDDEACPPIHETSISWEAWEAQGYTGLELWNGLSELKTRSKNMAQVLFYVFFPHFLAQAPHPQTLARWDDLLAKGKKIAVIGGSDAHALPVRAGFWELKIYPYPFHFRTINTHLLLPAPLSGEVETDKAAIYQAMAAGRGFIGYDLPAPTRGFRFTAQGRGGEASMGEEISIQGGVTLKVKLPQITPCRLLKDGKVLHTSHNRETCTHIITEPGVYRVEVFLRYLGKLRSWIYSNPIYVRG
jgi:hypothetical protein